MARGAQLVQVLALALAVLLALAERAGRF